MRGSRLRIGVSILLYAIRCLARREGRVAFFRPACGGRSMLDPIIADWLGLLLRWEHVMAGIAWIGTSFYFIWLDAGLRVIISIPRVFPQTPLSMQGSLFLN